VQEIHDLNTPATVAVGLVADPEKFERLDDPVRCSVVYSCAAMSFGPATPLS
jgi:hypothetical protein